MTTRYRHNNNSRRVRRRLNPEFVKLRVYSSNYTLPMSENRFEVFPMNLVSTEKMVKLGERDEHIPLTFISTLTAETFIYPPGVIFKEGNEYFLKIRLADLDPPPEVVERLHQEGLEVPEHDLENWDGLPQDSEGSIKIKINMENGALDNIDMPDGPWKFYSDELTGVDSFGKKPLKIPTDEGALQSAEGALQAYREEERRIDEMNDAHNNPFGQGHGSAAGFGIGGKRRRKKRTKKKSRRRKRKTLKKKRKRRKKKRKTRR